MNKIAISEENECEVIKIANIPFNYETQSTFHSKTNQSYDELSFKLPFNLADQTKRNLKKTLNLYQTQSPEVKVPL